MILAIMMYPGTMMQSFSPFYLPGWLQKELLVAALQPAHLHPHKRSSADWKVPDTQWATQWCQEPLIPYGLDTKKSPLQRNCVGANYTTHIVGKWHLGFCNKKFANHQGFEHHYRVLNGGRNTSATPETEGMTLGWWGRSNGREWYLLHIIDTTESGRAHFQPWCQQASFFARTIFSQCMDH